MDRIGGREKQDSAGKILLTFSNSEQCDYVGNKSDGNKFGGVTESDYKIWEILITIGAETNRCYRDRLVISVTPV